MTGELLFETIRSCMNRVISTFLYFYRTLLRRLWIKLAASSTAQLYHAYPENQRGTKRARKAWIAGPTFLTCKRFSDANSVSLTAFMNSCS